MYDFNFVGLFQMILLSDLFKCLSYVLDVFIYIIGNMDFVFIFRILSIVSCLTTLAFLTSKYYKVIGFQLIEKDLQVINDEDSIHERFSKVERNVLNSLTYCRKLCQDKKNSSKQWTLDLFLKK